MSQHHDHLDQPPTRDKHHDHNGAHAHLHHYDGEPDDDPGIVLDHYVYDRDDDTLHVLVDHAPGSINIDTHDGSCVEYVKRSTVVDLDHAWAAYLADDEPFADSYLAGVRAALDFPESSLDLPG